MDMDAQTYALLLIGSLLVADRIVGYLKARGIDLQEMSSEIKDLHQWHDVNDEDGVKLWYVRKSLGVSLADLASAIREGHILTERMVNTIQGHGERIDRLVQEVRDK